MKSRFLKSRLEELEKSKLSRIIVITGARQTGKTTLALNCFPKYKYLSIEDPVLRMEYKKLTASRWSSSFPFAILDEVQKEPVLIESIKAVYDQSADTRYILLGSSQLLLLSKVRESLAGRCVIEEVLPLTIPEILSDSWDSAPENSFYQNFLREFKLQDYLPSFSLHPDYARKYDAFHYYLNYGGYPALVDKNLTDRERRDWLKNYIKTYLERDIRDLAEFKFLEPFVKFQQITALLTGQLINYSQLGAESGVSSKTAARFLNYLGISYQTILLSPWYGNSLKRLVKSPKLHYLDPGVQRAILDKTGMSSGNEFESAVISEIYKQTKVLGFGGKFYHLRTHDGAEVDLLLETEKGFIAFEIKMTQHIRRNDVRHLLKLKEILDKPLIQGFVLSNDNEIQAFDENILAMPAAMFLS